MFVKRLPISEKTTSYELSGSGGLPTRVVSEKINITSKNCSYLREIPKLICSAAGAWIGVFGGVTAGTILLIGVGVEKVDGRVALPFGLTCITMGAGIGAVIGNKIGTYAVNLICGRK